MFIIDVKSKEIHKQLTALAIALEYRTPLMRKIAGIMHASTMDNFKSGGRPKWLGIKYRKGKPLVDNGNLLNSINENQGSDNNEAWVGSNLSYAAIHQFGGKTKPRVIRPKNKKSLYFGGRFVKQVNHPGSTIPARPFLQLTETDKADILDAVNDYLEKI